MKQLNYSEQLDDQIIEQENEMLSGYTQHIEKYKMKFEELGFTLNVGLFWKYFSKDNIMYQRIGFRNGYECYVYYVVEKDGRPVRISSDDGDADYYELSSSTMISCLTKHGILKVKIVLFSDIDETVDSDLTGFLELLYSKAKQT